MSTEWPKPTKPLLILPVLIADKINTDTATDGQGLSLCAIPEFLADIRILFADKNIRDPDIRLGPGSRLSDAFGRDGN